MTETLRRTPLYQKHIELGGKMVPFAGWEMAVQYSGIIEEHKTVREKAGLFDVCHMGEIIVRGRQAEAALQHMTCNNLASIEKGHAQYNAIINPSGGVVDDIIVYKRGDEDFFVCVNASNTEKDFNWFNNHNTFDAEIINESSKYGQVAIQGPRGKDIMDSVLGRPISESLAYFTFEETLLKGIPVMIARTGYTGEDGFEIFIPVEKTEEVWDMLLEAGRPFGLIPCGLGARDTLRLEACYPLHGHELGDEISAIESGLGWIVKPEKGEFTGRDILARQKAEGSPRVLVAFVADGAGIVREHTPIVGEDGAEKGFATSGTKTPTLNKAIGMALVSRELGSNGAKFFADVRGRKIECHVVPKPLYKTNAPAPSLPHPAAK